MSAQVIVALDVPAAADIPPIVERLPPGITWYKVGLELFAAEGPAPVRMLRDAGKNVFLDLKLHDIPRTVERAVTAAAAHGVGLMTVHAAGGHAMLEAAAGAAAACGENRPRLLAVTTLTSLDQSDLTDIGVTRPLADHTLALGQLAIDSGIDGLVCSAHEAAGFRAKLGDDAILVTPGVRPAGADVGDQKRVMTPAQAVAAGASFLVIGRPIVQAPDPAKAATDILAEIEGV